MSRLHATRCLHQSPLTASSKLVFTAVARASAAEQVLASPWLPVLSLSTGDLMFRRRIAYSIPQPCVDVPDGLFLH